MPIYMQVEGITGNATILPAEQQAIRSFLINGGVSVAGAQEFAAGNYVNNAQDRKLLAKLMSSIAKSATIQKTNG